MKTKDDVEYFRYNVLCWQCRRNKSNHSREDHEANLRHVRAFVARVGAS